MEEPRVVELSSSEEEEEVVEEPIKVPEPEPEAHPEEESSKEEDTKNEQKDEEETMDPAELAELVAKAEKFKEQGNTHFTQKDYVEAVYYYTNGLDILPKKNPLAAILYSNRAACFFAQEDWKKTIEDTTKALEIDENYTKALFRRATAYEHTKDFVKALAEIEPNPHPSAKRAIKHLPPLAQKQEEEERAKMMDDLKGLGNKFLGLFGMSLDNFEAKQDPSTGSYSIQFNPNPSNKQ